MKGEQTMWGKGKYGDDGRVRDDHDQIVDMQKIMTDPEEYII